MRRLRDVDAAAADEGAVLDRARAGDRAAWEQLVALHAPRLAAYLGARLQRPAVVERLVGETIVAAWERLSELEPGAPFAPWFRRLGAQATLRWRQEHPTEKLREPFPPERCADAPQMERMAALQEALRQMSEPERMALEQRFRAGLTGEALADVLHCDVQTAELLVERALLSLDRVLRT